MPCLGYSTQDVSIGEVTSSLEQSTPKNNRFRYNRADLSPTYSTARVLSVKFPARDPNRDNRIKNHALIAPVFDERPQNPNSLSTATYISPIVSHGD